MYLCCTSFVPLLFLSCTPVLPLYYLLYLSGSFKVPLFLSFSPEGIEEILRCPIEAHSCPSFVPLSFIKWHLLAKQPSPDLFSLRIAFSVCEYLSNLIWNQSMTNLCVDCGRAPDCNENYVSSLHKLVLFLMLTYSRSSKNFKTNFTQHVLHWVCLYCIEAFKT